MQIHLWRLDVKGSGATKDICIKGTEQEHVVRGEARKWMESSERVPLSA